MPEKTAADAAIEFHSGQSERFASYYHHLQDTPYAASFIYTRRRLDSLLFRLLPERGDGLRLLDLGCGTGRYMAEMSRRGFEVAGVDGSAEMLAHARANNPGARALQADVNAIPFPDGHFDYVLCVEVLRYLPDLHPCVREMARVVKPGGVCLATATPLFNSNAYFLVNRIASRVRVGRLSPLKQYFATSGALRRAFLAAGFDRPEIHGLFTGPINWVEHLTPGLFPRLLKAWEPVDSAIADLPILREFSNQFLVKAVRK